MADFSCDSDTESVLSEFNFKYVAEDELSRVIKKVRRDRQKKQEQRMWEEFCRSKEKNEEKTVADQISLRVLNKTSNASEVVYDASIQVELNDVCSNFFCMSLEEDGRQTNRNRSSTRVGSAQSAGAKPRQDGVDQRGCFKDYDYKDPQRRDRSKSLDSSSFVVPSIDLQDLNEETRSYNQDGEYSIRYEENDNQSISSSVVFSKHCADSLSLRSHNMTCSGVGERPSRDLYEDSLSSEEEGSERAVEMIDAKSDRKYNSASNEDCSSGTAVTLTPRAITFEDPLFVNKVKIVRSKIGILLEDISLSHDVLEPNCPADQLKLRKRDLEFYSRFSRNYLYELQRQLIKLNALLNISRKKETVLKTASQKLIIVHQLVLRGLQAYIKHAPTSLEQGIPDRLRELTANFMKLTDMCIDIGILKHDELRMNCLRLFHSPKDTMKVPPLDIKKPAKKTKKMLPKEIRSTMTMRNCYSAQNSPYFNKPAFKRKLNSKPSLQSITEHQILRQKSAPKAKSSSRDSARFTIDTRPRSTSSIVSTIGSKINETSKKISMVKVQDVLPAEPKRNSPRHSNETKVNPLKEINDYQKNHEEDKIPRFFETKTIEVEKIQDIARYVIQETLQPLLEDITQLIEQNKMRNAIATDARAAAIGEELSKSNVPDVSSLGGTVADSGSAHRPKQDREPHSGGAPAPAPAPAPADVTAAGTRSAVTATFGPSNAKLICIISTDDGETAHPSCSDQEEVSPTSMIVCPPSETRRCRSRRKDWRRSAGGLKQETVRGEQASKHRRRSQRPLEQGKESTPPLAAQKEKEKENSSSLIVENSGRKISVENIRMSRGKLRGVFVDKKRFVNTKICNAMCNKMWERQPLELIENVSEVILDEAILGMVDELSIEKTLRNLVDLEFCPT